MKTKFEQPTEDEVKKVIEKIKNGEGQIEKE